MSYEKDRLGPFAPPESKATKAAKSHQSVEYQPIKKKDF